MIAVNAFIGEGRMEFWRDSILVLPDHDSLGRIEEVPFIVSLLPLVAALGGIATAYLCYMFRPELPGLVTARFRGIYLFLLNKWYFDELYDFLFVRPTMRLGRLLWKGGDGFIIDGFGPDGVSAWVLDVTKNVVRLQTGYLYHYAFAMMIGVAGFITWFMFAGAH
jgi:NADH-quinone oxidoreductase subunit L